MVLGYLKGHPESPAAEGAALAAWQALLDAGKPPADDTVAGFPDKLRPFAEILQARSERDPSTAAAKLTAAWNPDASPGFIDASRQTVGVVAKNYVLTAPQEALTWALALPSSAWREQALSEAAGMTARGDPASLSEWLNTVTPSPELDKVIVRLVSEVPDDPQAAYAWASRISSAPLREKAQAEVIAGARPFDPATGPQGKPAAP
jgi:hypothetical protein